ncbi:hypothetical protein OG21DRAFT_781345 [Imleria badia]|nr:hypothetical protein OG21DRAFT_781345 [Imleria badia]
MATPSHLRARESNRVASFLAWTTTVLLMEKIALDPQNGVLHILRHNTVGFPCIALLLETTASIRWNFVLNEVLKHFRTGTVLSSYILEAPIWTSLPQSSTLSH